MYFPAMKSVSASVLHALMWTGASCLCCHTMRPGRKKRAEGQRERVWQVSGRSAGIAVECSGAWRGCGRTCWVREEGQGREPLHHGRLPVCVVPCAHTLLSPSYPCPLDWFSIPAHQGVIESLGVSMDGGAATTDSPCWNAIHSSQVVLKLG